MRASSPREAARFHVVGDGDVIGENVELPLAGAEHAAEHSAAVHAHAHVDAPVVPLAHQVHRLDHGEPHLHAAVGVVGPCVRQPGHAQVAVAQQLDAETAERLAAG